MEKSKYQIFNGFTLKVIAALTMLIDHVGAIFAAELPNHVVTQMRIIGRISFPLFAFLLVQGFIHTSNRINYLARLLSFGVAIMLALSIGSMYGMQVPLVLNIFITLSLGLIAIWIIEQYWGTSKLLTSAIILMTALTAEGIHTDYGSYGVLMIVLLYIFRDKKIWLTVGFIALTALFVGLDVWRVPTASMLQLFAIAAIPLILMYNGKRGEYQWKYFFYLFYPLHFIGLMIIRLILFKY